MRKFVPLALAVVLAIGLPLGSAWADWVPADGHKMHFPQLPDAAGWDVNATQPLVLADDWMCSETGFVKDIHFWGSWMHGIDGQIIQFVLSIHADIPDPDGPGPLYSMPGPTLWEREITNFVAQPIDPPSMEGWYDPSTGMFIPNDHQRFYQYNVFLDQSQWFHQDAGTVYWLNISAIVANPAMTQWGWKSTLNHWNDDAVWAMWGLLNWKDMFEPPLFHQSLDLSFVITAGKPVVEACCLQDGSCIMVPQPICLGQGGVPQGPGSQCTAVQACCLPGGACLDLDPLCCVQQGGVPQGAGTQCQAPQACCMPNGDCVMADPLCCQQMGGMPLGVGSVCTVREACCLPGGGCSNLDPLCCLVSQGAPQGIGSTCTQVRACCLPNGSCIMVDPFCCDDMGGVPSPIGAAACMGDQNQNGIDDACESLAPDTCTYYKAPYPDYAPVGMPDFDQKQNGWMGAMQSWSFCGPVALANCLWWFDSKFEPNPQPQPTYSDGYPLVQSYATMLPKWDDHSATNVIPLVDSLAKYSNCSGMTNGTFIFDLIHGAQNWITARGLNGYYTITPIKAPNPGQIVEEVLESQDVILLLGFYEILPTMDCSRLGGHYVTVAGVCEQLPRICISDPWFDNNEGEPPFNPAHLPAMHDDARLISGPHGSRHHDAYNLGQGPVCPNLPGSPIELMDYPDNWTYVANFYQQNPTDIPTPPIPYQGGMIHTVVEWAIVICPDSCALQKPGDVNNDGLINGADVIYLTNYINGGAAPPVQANADPNGNCCVDKADVAYLQAYVNGTGPAPVACTCVNPPLCNCRVGDANNDLALNIGDAVYVINYIFKGGWNPIPYRRCSGDANCDCVVNVGDAVYMINYIFKGGPAPCGCCYWLGPCGALPEM